MTPHEKKRVLESDIKSLTHEFLEVREKQLHVEEFSDWEDLEIRANGLLGIIAGKKHDIATLFPQAAPPDGQVIATLQYAQN